MNKIKKWLLISLLISFISGLIVILLTFDTGTIDALLSIKPEFILLGICLHAFSYLIWGMRIRVLCRALGHDIGVIKSVEIVTSSALAASITPSSLGGEPLRIHLLNMDRMSLGKASAVILGERLLDGILILSLAPFSIYIFRNILADSGFETILIVAEFFLVGILLLLMYAIWRPGPTRSFSYFIVNRITPFFSDRTDAKIEHVIKKVDNELDNFHESIVLLLKEGRKGLMIAIFGTLLFWVVEFSLLYVVLLGLNLHVDILAVFASQIIIMLLMVLPATPGASGVAELGAATVFSIFVPSHVLGITVLAWRALTFYMNLIVGSFVSFKILRDTDSIGKVLR
ncbi:flippase-like domain-containing protein [Methanolobus sp. ZRKC3]|uniref:lysylphosphatidylglycerol synthase transmembrane domain-containing protein n=1 Tax=Methanolobus sp. ZRKC3 TaxID=3125786 RepID=UPI00324AB3B2